MMPDNIGTARPTTPCSEATVFNGRRASARATASMVKWVFTVGIHGKGRTADNTDRLMESAKAS